MEEQGKVCTKCGIWKPFNEFYRHKGVKDGRNSHCKKCCDQWRKDNKERRKVWEEQYYKENLEHIKEVKKQYWENNKEIRSEYNKRWRRKNKEYRKEYEREYARNNKEKLAKKIKENI